MKIINLEQIRTALRSIDILLEIEQGFIAYSKGQTVIPPIGELLCKEPPGEVHIKYGYINHDDFYVVKIASGFYENFKLSLPSSNGVILVFSKKTGVLLGILLDEGFLTDVRTAAAGAIVSKYLAPKNVIRIGIVGSGTQAKLQLHFLQKIISCKDVLVWSRNEDNLHNFKEAMKNSFSVMMTKNLDEVMDTCNLIVTTTPSTQPLLLANKLKCGTHITAVGADCPHKQELDPLIFQRADIVVADSIIQCIERGDIAHAVKDKTLSIDKISELGNVIIGTSSARTSDNQITIADLTGIAVQDIQIAKCIYNHFQ